MKTVILTASLVSNIFLSALAYSFINGSVAYQQTNASYMQSEQDFVSELASK